MPDGPSGTVAGPVVRLKLVVESGMTTGLEAVPSAPTLDVVAADPAALQVFQAHPNASIRCRIGSVLV